MKVSIEKELDKRIQEKKQGYNIDPIKQVNQLLLENETEHARILRGLSDHSQFNRVERVRGQQIELETHEENYDGKVYTIDEIRTLCIDYRLRFLRSKYYTGSYDIEVATKIRDFATATNTPIEEHSLNYRFFVMAPANMFELKDERYISKRELDPAIFFQIDEKHYRLIHKWGSDFTVLRFLEGFKWRSWWTAQWCRTLTALPIVAFVLTYFFGSGHAFENHLVGLTILFTFVSFILAFFFGGIQTQDEGDQIDGFFTPHNWDSDKKLRR